VPEREKDSEIIGKLLDAKEGFKEHTKSEGHPFCWAVAISGVVLMLATGLLSGFTNLRRWEAIALISAGALISLSASVSYAAVHRERVRAAIAFWTRRFPQ